LDTARNGQLVYEGYGYDAFVEGATGRYFIGRQKVIGAIE
jgi:hypothetical protein